MSEALTEAERALLEQRARRYARGARAKPEEVFDVVLFRRAAARYATPLGALRKDIAGALKKLTESMNELVDSFSRPKERKVEYRLL